jgi:hypothetical protein
MYIAVHIWQSETDGSHYDSHLEGYSGDKLKMWGGDDGERHDKVTQGYDVRTISTVNLHHLQLAQWEPRCGAGDDASAHVAWPMGRRSLGFSWTDGGDGQKG